VDILDKAKSAGSLLVAIQTHDDTLNLAAFGEQLVDLLLGCVEGKIANVERG
jgi:hypothetical protein